MDTFPRWNYWMYDEDRKFIFDKDSIDRDNDFHNDDMDCDYDLWSGKFYWTVDEATALSFGKDPEKFKWNDEPWGVKALVDDSPFATYFVQLRKVIMADQTVGLLPEFLPPHLYLDWAARRGVDIPHLLDEKVRVSSPFLKRFAEYETLAKQTERLEIENWELKQKIQWLEHRLADAAAPSKPDVGNTREKNTLLRIILGLAIKHYAFPKPSRNAVAEKISETLSAVDADLGYVPGEGVSVGAQTIGDKLKEARNIVAIK